MHGQSISHYYLESIKTAACYPGQLYDKDGVYPGRDLVAQLLEFVLDRVPGTCHEAGILVSTVTLYHQ